MRIALRHRLPSRHAVCAKDDPILAIRCRQPCIFGRRLRAATGVRMIASDDLRPARPRIAVRGNQDRGINFKVGLRPRREIGSGPNIVDRRGLTQEQPAHLPLPICIGKRLKAGQQFA